MEEETYPRKDSIFFLGSEGSGCSTVVENTPRDSEVVGSIPTESWAFPVNDVIE